MTNTLSRRALMAAGAATGAAWALPAIASKSAIASGAPAETGLPAAARFAREVAKAMDAEDLEGWSITIRAGDAEQSLLFSHDDARAVAAAPAAGHPDGELVRLGDRLAQLQAEITNTMAEGRVLDDAAIEIAGDETGLDPIEQKQWFGRFMAARLANGGEACAVRGGEMCDEARRLSTRIQGLAPTTIAGLQAKFRALDWEIGYLLEDVDEGDQPAAMLRAFATELEHLAHG